MRTPFTAMVVSLAIARGAMAFATYHVVPPGTPGANPSGSFSTWAMAATNINDAVAIAQAGDTILVSNGIYALSATIEITKGITLQSFNTVPLPGGATDAGNIQSDPLFVDFTGFEFGLRGNSPCIDNGVYRDWMAGARDLAGDLRIRGEAVDMGAFEYLASGTVLALR